MLDPDGTYHPEEIPKLIAQSVGNYDVIIGDRLNGNLEPDAMTSKRIISAITFSHGLQLESMEFTSLIYVQGFGPFKKMQLLG